MSEKNKYKLSDIKKTEIFGVPDAYFENFDEKIFKELSDINKNKEFEIPEDYFEEFDLRILSKISETEEFSVPDNYFNNFENRLNEKIEEENREVKVISLKERIKQLAYIAGTAAAIIILALIFTNQKNNTFEINTLIDNNTLLLSDQELYSLLSDEEIEINSISYTSSLNEDEVIDYLSTSDLENIDLINE